MLTNVANWSKSTNGIDGLFSGIDCSCFSNVNLYHVVDLWCQIWQLSLRLSSSLLRISTLLRQFPTNHVSSTHTHTHTRINKYYTKELLKDLKMSVVVPHFLCSLYCTVHGFVATVHSASQKQVSLITRWHDIHLQQTHSASRHISINMFAHKSTTSGSHSTLLGHVCLCLFVTHISHKAQTDLWKSQRECLFI